MFLNIFSLVKQKSSYDYIIGDYKPKYVTTGITCNVSLKLNKFTFRSKLLLNKAKFLNKQFNSLTAKFPAVL